MTPEAAKFIGMGLATLPLLGVGLGLGLMFGKFFEGAFRNPSAAGGLTGTFYVAFALTEATGLFGLLIAFIILGS